MKPIYDPVEFVDKIGLVSLTIIGSFVTMKFLNAMYENIYEPVIDIVVDSDKSDQYYIKAGKYYIQTNSIVKELIKWILLIIILMIIYNIFIRKFRPKIANK